MTSIRRIVSVARVNGRELYFLALIPVLRALVWLASALRPIHPGLHERALFLLIRFANLLVRPCSGHIRRLREASRDLETYWQTYDALDLDLYAAALSDPEWFRGRIILDFGCGVGRKSWELARRGAAEVVGIDASARSIAVAKRMADGADHLRFENAYAQALDEGREGRFDVVVSFTVFEHVSDVAGALREIRRLLRPGGRSVLVFHHFDDKHGAHLTEFVHYPWPQLLFPEAALYRFWNRELAAAHAREEMGYFPHGYRHGLGEHNQDCYMNLNRLTVEEFESLLPASGLQLEREYFYSTSPLLAWLPALRRTRLGAHLRGSVAYVLSRPQVIPAKILVVILKDDYGDPARGDSYERVYFHRTLERMFRECRLFDYGPYLERTEALQADLLREAEAFAPDVIFFTLFTDQFAPETLDRLKARSTTVNWFCDDQWRFESFSSRYAPHFSWIVTTDRFALEKYRERGITHAILSQWAAGETLQELAREPGGYQHDVAFVGGANPFRTWVVAELAKRGITVACFGAGWPNGRVTQDGMTEIFRRTKINLNLSNSRSYDLRFALSSWGNFRHFRATPKNKEQVKGRHFEIGAWGGFQLTNYVEFLEDYFDLGKEIAVFGTLDDLPDKIRFYLTNDELRREIAAAGHRRIRREHTYDQRFLEIFRRMGLLAS